MNGTMKGEEIIVEKPKNNRTMKNMDAMLRAEIIATVRQTMTEVLEGAEEVWLTKEQLLAQFGMFTEEWLHRNGELLPRERAEVVMTDGSVKGSRWAYQQHKIQRMITERKLVNLRKGKVATAAIQ